MKRRTHFEATYEGVFELWRAAVCDAIDLRMRCVQHCWADYMVLCVCVDCIFYSVVAFYSWKGMILSLAQKVHLYYSEHYSIIPSYLASTTKLFESHLNSTLLCKVILFLSYVCLCSYPESNGAYKWCLLIRANITAIFRDIRTALVSKLIMHSTSCALTETRHHIELLNGESWIRTQQRVHIHARTHTIKHTQTGAPAHSNPGKGQEQ